MIVVLSAVLGLLDVSSRVGAKDAERILVIGEAQTGLYRMARQLREGTPPAGTSLPATPANQLDLIVKGKRVRYDCSVTSATGAPYRSCLRYSSTNLTSPPTTGGVLVVDRLMNGTTGRPVFTPNSATAPTGYAARIEVPSRGERKDGSSSAQGCLEPVGTTRTPCVVLDDGFYLRNVGQ
jgi:hypothetical protein